MFANVFRLELKRSCSPGKVAAIIFAIIILLVASGLGDFIGVYDRQLLKNIDKIIDELD